MTNIAVCGASGKMGKVINNLFKTKVLPCLIQLA